MHANACEYLRIKVEVAKVFELAKDNIDFGRRVYGNKKQINTLKSLIYCMLRDVVLN